jgi:hypothetical protein
VTVKAHGDCIFDVVVPLTCLRLNVVSFDLHATEAVTYATSPTAAS